MSNNGTTSLLTHVTTCRVQDFAGRPCGVRFTAPPMDVPIIGEPPGQKTIRMLQALGKHCAQKHPEHFQTTISGAQEFQGLLIGLSFDTTDPALLQLREMSRYNIHVLTRKNIVYDKTLINRVVSQEPITGEKAIGLLKNLRDALLELGKYSPMGAAPTLPPQAQAESAPE